MIKDFLKGLLSARQNRSIFRFYDLGNTLSSLSPELIDDLPPGKRALVIAPHCDDESLGCGGTLHKHHLQGHAVTAVFMTDGSMCDSPNGTQETIKTRKMEAERAAGILGIGQCIFLDHPDRQLRANETTIRQMEDILEKNNPDIVYLPFYLDNHPDHMETAHICLSALHRRPVKTILFYELWTTLIPNRLIDISNALENKMAAIQVYRSQTDIDSFAEKIKSLNRYRSLASNGKYQYAEAFLEVHRKDLGKFIQNV